MERIRTLGSKSGNCNICGKFGRLTDDHIPPKGLPNVGRALLQRLTDSMSSEPTKIGPRICQSGVSYRTLCEKCNTVLLGSEYDPHLIDLCKKIGNSASTNFYVPKNFTIKPNRIARSLIGHTLAHGLDQHRLGPFIDDLAEYFLDSTATIPEPYVAHFWIYPYEAQVVAKGVAQIFDYRFRQEPSVFNIIKFFPIGFLCANAPLPDTQTATTIRFDQLLSNDIEESVQITLSLSNHPPTQWPEVPGKHGCAFHHSDFSTIAFRQKT